MIEGFESFDFEGPLAEGDRIEHPVYVRGEGPPIIIWQELPGIIPETITLANKMADAGYTIYLPHFLGPLGKFAMGRNILKLLCIRREFHLFAARKSSPITNWMRALCHEVQSRHDGAQIGTLGMCLTGNFALTLMADDSVIGGVAAQPSLPMFKQAALHMSDDEVAAAKAAMSQKGPALAMRYSGDPLCKAVKLDAIREAFGNGVVTHTINGKGHATLTGHWSDEAYAKMMAYFAERFAKAA
jgi:dienelactone hydrolase